jgi:GT2 family glycosyltransferase
MINPVVSIIIVNYNTRRLSINCIQSIIKVTLNISYEIIMVDNASTDESVKAIKDEFPQVILIENEINIGFGRANNLAAQQAKGEFLFFLNSDTILFENSIEKLLNFFIENEQRLRIGSLGCVLVDNDKVFNGAGGDFPTSRKEALLLFQSLPVIGKLFSKIKTKEIPLNTTCFQIDYVIGADLMIKTSVFNQINGFDPSFFMYYEESDLQKRMNRDLDLKSYIYTKTQIIHLEDGSGKNKKKYSNRKRILVHTSRNIYLEKHDRKDFYLYKNIEYLYCVFSKFNFKYTHEEHKEFLNALKRNYI